MTDEFDAWLDAGIKNGWITEPFCYTHDVPSMTEDEVKAFDEDHDPCIYAVRLVEDDYCVELTKGNRS